MSKTNGDIRQRAQNGTPVKRANGVSSEKLNGATQAGKNEAPFTKDEEAKSSANTLNLLVCVAGIYVSLFVHLIQYFYVHLLPMR